MIQFKVWSHNNISRSSLKKILVLETNDRRFLFLEVLKEKVLYLIYKTSILFKLLKHNANILLFLLIDWIIFLWSFSLCVEVSTLSSYIVEIGIYSFISLYIDIYIFYSILF